MKTITLIIVGMAIVLGLGIWLNSGTTTQQLVTYEEIAWGTLDAPVELVEYSDFQCPACAVYHGILSEIELDYATQVRFVHKHFPLTNIHPNALSAARAAEAAWMQGRFKVMQDVLYARQNEWGTEGRVANTFTSYAQELGLDVERFTQDYSSARASNKPMMDQQEGIRLGVDSTPTFFLNGEKIVAPQSVEGFRALLDAAIAQQAGVVGDITLE